VGSQDIRGFQRGNAPAGLDHGQDAEQTSAWARIFAGGEDPANYVVRMRMLLARFPGSPDIGQLAGKFSGEVRLLRSMVGTGVAATVISTALPPGTGSSRCTGPLARLRSPIRLARGIGWSRPRPLLCPPRS